MVSFEKSALIRQLLRVADCYCAATGQTRSSLAKALLGRGGQLDDLSLGKRDIATGTYEKAMRWLSSRWPADAAWPLDVERPAPEDIREAAE